MLSYKVSRAERNLQELKKQLEEMATGLDLEIKRSLEDASNILECSFDAAIDERDEQKIHYLARGTIRGLTSEDVSVARHVDFAAMLLQCSVVDLVILESLYTHSSDIRTLGGYPKWLERSGLTQDDPQNDPARNF